MKKYRKLVSVIFLGVLSIVNWCYHNSSIFQAAKDINLSKRDVLLNMVNSGSGYQSYSIYGMILEIFFVILYEYTSNGVDDFRLVRCKNRKQYCMKQIKYLIIYSVLFSSIYEIIGVIGVNMNIPSYILKETNWFMAEMIQYLCCICLYVKAGIIYNLIKLYMRKGNPIMVTSLIYIAEYFTFINMGNMWMPISDAVLVQKIIFSEVTYVDVILCFFRSLSLIGIYLYLYIEKFLRKDVMKFEN